MDVFDFLFLMCVFIPVIVTGLLQVIHEVDTKYFTKFIFCNFGLGFKFLHLQGA